MRHNSFLKLIFFSASLVCMLNSCEDKGKIQGNGSRGQPPSYDPQRGIGKWDQSNVDVSAFDPAMAGRGKEISLAKCSSCHKPTDEMLVGPGWKGVTMRHTPYWIMNFITNPDPMIDADPAVQKQLELCLVRMPGQGLPDAEARAVLEYMREIDAE